MSDANTAPEPETLPEVYDEDETTLVIPYSEASKIFPEQFPPHKYSPPNPAKHPLWKRVAKNSKGEPLISVERFRRVTWVSILIERVDHTAETIVGAAVRSPEDADNQNIAWAQAVWNALEHHQRKIDARRARRKSKV